MERGIGDEDVLIYPRRAMKNDLEEKNFI